MTAETIARGHGVYLEMLNAGEIENGLGGEIQKAKKRKYRNDWGRSKPARGKRPATVGIGGRFVDFRSF